MGMLRGIVRHKASIGFVAAAAIAAALLCGCSQQSEDRSAAAASELADQLREIEERSYAAWAAGDAEFWSADLSESYVGWGATGRTDKRAAVELLSSADCRIAYQNDAVRGVDQTLGEIRNVLALLEDEP